MHSKKAIMAIGTLIIFIAMILISAIVAGFLIGTTGILQQRASFVSKETESRLTAGVEVLSLYSNANVSSERINDYEILTRLSSGSYPMNIRYISLVFNTKDNSYPMSVQDDFYATYSTIEVPSLSINSSSFNILDLDQDGLEESIYLRRYNATNDTVDYISNTTYIIFNFSQGGYMRMNIGNLSNVSINHSTSLKYIDYPIDADGKIYGFVQMNAKVYANYTAPTFRITEYPKKCTFDSIISFERFCYQVQLGNNNSVVEKGELFKLRFKIPENLTTDEPFELQVVPKTGAIQRIKGTTPSVIVLKQVVLYP
jgi:archaellin